MNTRTIASTLAALLLGASLTACGGADTTSDLSASADETLGDFDQVEAPITACDDQQYDHWRYLSALAVAAGNELGRWNAAKDFTSQWNGIQLSSEGAARCTDGCPNIAAILSLQADESKVIPRHDPALIRQYMKSFFDRQVNWNNSNAVPNHKLVLNHVSNATCGLRYHFTATDNSAGSSSSTTSSTTSSISGTSDLKATHSGKYMDVVGVSYSDGATIQQYSQSFGANQKFSVEATSGGKYRLKASHSGKCLGIVGNSTADGAVLEQRSCGSMNSQEFFVNAKGSGNFELKNANSGKCVEVRYASTANGGVVQQSSCNGSGQQTFNATAWNVSTSTTSSSTSNTSGGANLPDPGVLWKQLKFAGENENKYLSFQYTSTEVSIDPMGTMVDGGAEAQSGSCVEGTSLYDASRTSGGKCCVHDGVYGSLQQAAWNKNLYYCK